MVLLAFPLAAAAQAAAAQAAAQQPPIQDNSFLIEEAYNQEPGVVQHIGNLSLADGGERAFTFTQEWPLAGVRHQASYTVPVLHADGAGTGIGDLALNYRYQLVGAGDDGARTFVAPRLTLLLPTGSEARGRGAGGPGLQVNLPLSFIVLPRLAAHWNAGTTVTASARDAAGRRATTASFNLGASAIWLVRPSVNVMLEAVWQSVESAAGAGATEREESVFLNPGVRWAINFRGGLQVVPGVAYTVGLGPSAGDDAVFLYLSFEHPY